MDLHRIGIKFFAEEGSTVELVEFIPVFHRWIQNHMLDQLLIDAADYSHIHYGPGIVLVAHEGNYSIDETGNRRGLTYYSKHELDGEMVDRLAAVSTQALAACQLLEKDEEIDGRIRFPCNELQILANDRLQAPNTDDTWSTLEPAINEFLGKLFDGNDYSIERDTSDPRERFQITVKTPEAVGVGTLIQRLEN